MCQIIQEKRRTEMVKTGEAIWQLKQKQKVLETTFLKLLKLKKYMRMYFKYSNE